MAVSSFLFINGVVVDPAAGIFGRRDLLVRDGRVARMAPSLVPGEGEEETLRIYDLRGWYLLPGLVDLHTHLRVPGQEHKETIRTGTLAAAAGGFTSILTMANTAPPVDRPRVLRLLKERIDREAVVRVFPVAAVTVGLKGSRVARLEALAEAGAVAFSEDGFSVRNARLLREAMERARDVDRPVISHCEDRDLAAGGSVQEGEVAERLGVSGIPSAAEDVVTARDLCLAAETGVRLHVAHVSTARSIEMIRLAKEKGIPVSAEVTPHHLMLTDRDVLRLGAAGKVNPPLRPEEDRRAMREALRDGTVDAVASDHAPHHPEEKALGLEKAPFGVIGMETTLPLLLGLVDQGVIGLERAVELLSSGPAGVMKLEEGRLGEGGAADLVVVDPERDFVVEAASFRSKARNTPFGGWRLKGRAVLTLVGGRVVFADEGAWRGRVETRQGKG